jgi:hypothetical protein
MTNLVRTAALIALFPLRYYAYLTEPRRARSLASAPIAEGLRQHFAEDAERLHRLA